VKIQFLLANPSFYQGPLLYLIKEFFGFLLCNLKVFYAVIHGLILLGLIDLKLDQALILTLILIALIFVSSH
jgi:hypothetical protein